jgi:hypothetical protein
MARRKKTNEDQSSENIENTDETFGLPEIEYEPLKREQTQEEVKETTETSETQSSEEKPNTYEREEVHHEYTTTNTYENDLIDEEPPSVWPKVLGILAIVLLAGGAYWFFQVYRPKQKALAEKQRVEDSIRTENLRQEQLKNDAEQRRLADEKRVADSIANAKTAIGAIETLKERTGRYYVVIASAIDGDLIMDYAKKLVPKGVSSKIIPPHGKVKFYRLAIADGDTYADTQSTADGMKDQYGGAVWVVKY